MINESLLKSQLCKLIPVLLSDALVMRHEDDIRIGMPDISVTWGGRTTWLEVKHVTPKKPFKTREIQLVTCEHLDRQGRCWYVIYKEAAGFQNLETIIVSPQGVRAKQYKDGGRRTPGFDHVFVIKRCLQGD